jgi:ABC-2 type transport system ATP-binding protein
MLNIAHGGSTSLADTDGDSPEGEAVLVAEGIEQTYGSPIPFRREVEVLDGAALAITPGEVVGIVGENGSGKSTLMKILVGALSPDAGTVERSGRVGWCPQEPLLYDRLTVRETFRLFGEAYGMAPEAVAEARTDYADRLDFAEYLDYRIDHLSGGNRQKVNLSVALMHDPDVLLLDEPYTGFDWDTYLAFWDLTEHLTEQGTAVAIISHLINERERFDRVYELADGTLAERPGPDDTDDRQGTVADGGIGAQRGRIAAGGSATTTGSGEADPPASGEEATDEDIRAAVLDSGEGR